MKHNAAPRALNRPFWTPGVEVMLGLMGIGLAVVVVRFVLGLSAVTHLDNSYPWGLWIAIDVAGGVALAAGGFTSAALIHIFHREHYRSLARPALLTALLGYIFVAIGLSFDLGRPYNIWHPIVPWMANPRSVLFEVGICVMAYLTVLLVEFAPVLCERGAELTGWPRLARRCDTVRSLLDRLLFFFVIVGVVLSCAHQSSLGSLMLIAPTKVHPLWWTPFLPVLFLLSALAVGFPMVIMESIWASRGLKLRVETAVLRPLSRIIPVLLGIYLAVKIGDLLIRESWVYLLELTPYSVAFGVEVGVGVVLPLVLLLVWRRDPSVRVLFGSSMLVVIGVALNRINVFLVAYQPHSGSGIYVPALTEWVVTISLIAAFALSYRIIVSLFPVIEQEVAPPSETDIETDIETEVEYVEKTVTAA